MKIKKYIPPKEVKQAIKLLQLAWKAKDKNSFSYLLYAASDKISTAKHRI